MQDRVPTYPGRVRMTPVAGQANVYDMTMADEPVEVGTPLNKATMLKDATASLFGLTDAVPDDVLSWLGNYINDDAVKIATGSYVGTGTYDSSSPNSLTFDFSPEMVFMLGITNTSNITSPVFSSTGGQGLYVMCKSLLSESWNGCGFSATNSASFGKISADEKTFYWYNGSSGSAQYNAAGYTYHWLAIG